MCRRVFVGIALVLLLSACSAEETSPDPPTSMGQAETTTSTTLIALTTSTTNTSRTTPATTGPGPTPVRSPGTYTSADLEIHVGFKSEVPDLTSEEFAAAAMTILSDPDGWARAGFTFGDDAHSDLVVTLAEGHRVDELCLPLETFGNVSCQNGNTVALNADRWRHAWQGWDSTVEAYRHYLVTHELGHLIGLRHPADKCPAGQPSGAVMDPQTRTTLHCPGNGVPLNWEIEWARNRPVVIGPPPDWEGPRPDWPSDG